MEESSVNSRQVGGTHYGGGDFQHWDWVAENFGPGYLIGCATKYICRWRKKDGTAALAKAQHYIEKLIALYADQHINYQLKETGVEKLQLAYNLTEQETAICLQLVLGQYRKALQLLNQFQEKTQ